MTRQTTHTLKVLFRAVQVKWVYSKKYKDSMSYKQALMFSMYTDQTTTCSHTETLLKNPEAFSQMNAVFPTYCAVP